MPTVELSLDQVAHALENLSPGELETLEIMLNPKLEKEIKERWEHGKEELSKGKVISKEDLFKEDQCIE